MRREREEVKNEEPSQKARSLKEMGWLWSERWS